MWPCSGLQVIAPAAETTLDGRKRSRSDRHDTGLVSSDEEDDCKERLRGGGASVVERAPKKRSAEAAAIARAVAPGRDGRTLSIGARLDNLARAEKDAGAEAARSDKKVWERLLRESERQLREVEKQRDRAQAAAAEANTARKNAQDALEAARRSDSSFQRAAASR